LSTTTLRMHSKRIGKRPSTGAARYSRRISIWQ